jgi:hypothetical protein
VRSSRRAILLAATLAVATAAPVVHAAPAPRAARACSTLRLDVGEPLGRVTVRFKLFGHVTCAKAHSRARAYFRKVVAHQCGRLNNFCNLSFAGGWNCSIFSAGESQTAGGAFAGCARSARTKFRMFRR